MSQHKIKELDKLNDLIASYKKYRQTIVLCHGVFDLLHIGHIKHFEKAKTFGDILIVSVTPDKFVNKGPGRPIFNTQLRAEAIAALDCVDLVIINRWPTSAELIEILEPDVYVKGVEYKDSYSDITGNINREKSAIEMVGGRIEFTDEITFSSSNLIHNNTNILSEKAKKYLDEFKIKYDYEEIISYIDKIENMKILVIGETIIDEYRYGNSLGKAGKDPMIAFQVKEIERYPGGVLAVANHLATFCKNIDLLTVLGRNNSNKKFVRENLECNIEPMFFYKKNSPTITKTRFINLENNAKIFELYDFNDKELCDRQMRSISDMLDTLRNKYDLVIVCDFGHGMFTKQLRDTLKVFKYIAVNTQRNAGNQGLNTINKYEPNYMCIDENELRLATGEKHINIEKLMERYKAETIMISRGQYGNIVGYPLVKTPALSNIIVDKVGAGDALLSITSPLAALKAPTNIIGFIGNVMGALALQYMGNKESVTKDKLYKYIEVLFK